MVFDATQDFNASFHVGGILLFVAGLLFCTLHLPYFREQTANRDDILDVQEIPDFPEDLHLCDDLDPQPTPV